MPLFKRVFTYKMKNKRLEGFLENPINQDYQLAKILYADYCSCQNHETYRFISKIITDKILFKERIYAFFQLPEDERTAWLKLSARVKLLTKKMKHKKLDDMSADDFLRWMNTPETNKWWDDECEKRKHNVVESWKGARKCRLV